MKPTDTLTTLFNHHLWANLRLLEKCAELTSEQLETTSPGARGSIHETLQHIVTAEQSYFSRISTGEMFRRPEDPVSMTIPEMMETIRSTGSGLIEWVAKIGADDTVQLDWRGEPRDVPKTIILCQAISHAHEHREQVKASLTSLGIEPPDLQSWVYYDELKDE